MTVRPPLADPAVFLATWGGVGYLPGAPGTWGSLAALPVAALLAWLGGVWALAPATVVLSAVGLWAARGYMQHTDMPDPGPVVIDEVAGQWLACLATGLSPSGYGAAFLLFRLFDVLKPWPIGWADARLPGATGVMLDDLLAGGYACLVLAALRYWDVLP